MHKDDHTIATTAARLDDLLFAVSSIDSQARLEAFIEKHLAEIISYYGKDNESLTKSVTLLVTHIKRRLGESDDVKMPLKNLILLIDGATNPYILNISLFFIKLGVKTAKPDQCRDIIIPLFDAIVNLWNNRLVTDELCYCVVICLSIYNNIKRMEYPKFIQDKIKCCPDLRRILCSFFKHTLAFPNETADVAEQKLLVLGMDKFVLPPPGSKNPIYVRLHALTRASKIPIISLKITIIKMLSFHVFEESEIFHLLIMARAYPANEVNSIAEGALKSCDVKKNLEHQGVIDRLFTLFLGKPSESLPYEDRVGIASYEMRVLILTYLSRSTRASTMFPLNVKVAYACLFQEYEDSTLKIMVLSIEYLKNIITNFPPMYQASFSLIFFGSLTKLINECEYTKVVVYAYQCMGLIATKNTDVLLVKNDGILVETLDALSTAPQDVESAIFDCLVQWLEVFKGAKNDKRILDAEVKICQFLREKRKSCGLIAIKYFEILLKQGKIEHRWLLIKAYANDRLEIRQECERLLNLSLAECCPDVGESICYLSNKLRLEYDIEDKNLPDEPKIRFTGETYTMAANYILAIIAVTQTKDSSAGKAFLCKSAPDEKLDQVLVPIKSYYEENRKVILEKESSLQFWMIAFKGLDLGDTRLLHAMVLNLPNVDKSKLEATFGDRCKLFFKNATVSSNKHDVNNICGLIYAMLLKEDEKAKIFEEIETTLTTSTNYVSGNNWILIHLALQLGAKYYIKALENFRSCIQETIKVPSINMESMLTSCAELVRLFLFYQQNEYKSNAGEINAVHATFVDLISPIPMSMKDTITHVSKSAAIKILGFLSSIRFESDLTAILIEKLMNIGSVAAQPELQFTVGDSLFDCLFGEASPLRQSMLLPVPEDATQDFAVDLMNQRLVNLFLKPILVEKAIHQNRHIRNAAFIWLAIFCQSVCEVKSKVIFDGVAKTLKTYISVIQQTFVNGLTEQNELVQDVCSKGLGFIFDMASEENRNDLLNELIDTMSSGKPPVIKITDDTPLFEINELGKTPDGGNLSTYKEICSLATDMNQPDLVYKFMSLASHNALWNSKKGAAFSVSTLLEKLGKDAIDSLGALIPKLYRYTYDPDAKIQMSMKAIWKAITSNSPTVVEKHSLTILKELMPTLTNPEWRMREASCLALGDLLSTYLSVPMYPYFGELLTTLLRVQDDHKESVRVAAERCLKQLEKAVIKSAIKDRNNVVLECVLPVLVQKGMQSTCPANVGFSLNMVMKITKEVNTSIKPYLGTIITCLLDAMSETEPAVVNYLAARSDEDTLSSLDSARASAARVSPMMTTLHDCIPLVDDQIFQNLLPLFVDKMKNSIGFTTRSGVANLIINLSHRRQELMARNKQVCDRLALALAQSGLSDRNATIRKLFGQAISYLIKHCAESTSNRIISDYICSPLLKCRDTEDYDENKLQTVGQLIKNIHEHSDETLKPFMKSIVPYIFLIISKAVSKQVPKEVEAKEFWEGIWEELVATTEIACKNYYQDIMACAMDSLNNCSVYKLKAASAVVIAKVVEVVGKTVQLGEITALFNQITDMFKGRIWDGKEMLFEPLIVSLQYKGLELREYWDTPTKDVFFSAIYAQCEKKKKFAYLTKAIQTIALLIEKLDYKVGVQHFYVLVKGALVNDENVYCSEDDEPALKKEKFSAKLGYEGSACSHIGRVQCVSDKEFKIGCMYTLNVLKGEYYLKTKQNMINSLSYFMAHREFEKVDVSDLVVIIGELWRENCGKETESFAAECKKFFISVITAKNVFIDNRRQDVQNEVMKMVVNAELFKDHVGKKVENFLKCYQNWPVPEEGTISYV
uniref:DUF3730 domain-containing protein n=1 Tax=Rhabditophanes sp. KR3021 TaxID=114890 RepID=A0AC35TJA1_9BILA